MSTATEFWTREMFEDAGVDPDTLEPVPGGPADRFERILAREAPQMATMTPATSATITIGDRTIEAADVTFDAEPRLTEEMDKIPTRTAMVGSLIVEHDARKLADAMRAERERADALAWLASQKGERQPTEPPRPRVTRPPNRKERRAAKARRRSA